VAKSMDEARALLDRINETISEYDPVLKERARDILIAAAFDGSPLADVGRAGAPHPSSPGRREAGGGNGRSIPTHPAAADGFAPLLQQWRPRKASERALLSAYYLAEVRGETHMTSQAINGELKEHGLAVSNITRAIDTNLRARPPLMRQTRKLGRTRQARKEYRMTSEGIEAVRARIEG
jgi:hypothetical protein